MYLKELKIGNVNLKNNILLAPMAGNNHPAISINMRKIWGTG